MPLVLERPAWLMAMLPSGFIPGIWDGLVIKVTGSAVGNCRQGHLEDCKEPQAGSGRLREERWVGRKGEHDIFWKWGKHVLWPLVWVLFPSQQMRWDLSDEAFSLTTASSEHPYGALKGIILIVFNCPTTWIHFHLHWNCPLNNKNYSSLQSRRDTKH